MRRAFLLLGIGGIAFLLFLLLRPPSSLAPPPVAPAAGPRAAIRPEPAPSTDDDAEATADPAAREVTVRVLARGSGDPVAGADVEIGRRRGRTGADGAVRLALVPTCFDSGGGRFSFRPGPPFRVAAGGYLPVRGWMDVPTEGEIVLFLTPATGTVSGVVLSPDGEPLAGAVVAYCWEEYLTGPKGRFGPIPVGAEFIDLEVHHPDFAGVTDAFRRSPDTDAEWREIVLAPAAFALGEVVDENGSPVPGARIFREVGIHRDPWLGAIPRSSPLATTGPDGRFRLPLLEGEASEVELLASGYADPQRVHEMRAGEESRIRVWHGAILAGRVVTSDGAGAPGILLYGFHENEGYGVEGGTGPNGEFRLGPLAPGRQSVRARRGDTWLTKWTVDVPRAGLVAGVELELPPNRVVRGRVIDDVTGRPVAGVAVGVSADPLGARTGVDGEFRLELPIEESRRGVSIGFEAADHLPATESLSTDHPERNEVRLVPAGRVRLRVVDGTGRPVAGARVRWTAGEWKEDENADAEGRAELRVPAGSVRLQVSADAGVTETDVSVAAGASVDLGDLVLTTPRAGVDVILVDPEGKPIPGARIERLGNRLYVTAPGFERRRYLPGATIALRRTGPIAGRVVDERGVPVPRAQVDTGVPGQWSSTDGLGRFRLEGLLREDVHELSVRESSGHLESPRVFARTGEGDVVLVSPRAGVLSFLPPSRPEEPPSLPVVLARLPLPTDELGLFTRSPAPWLEGGRVRCTVPTGDLFVEIVIPGRPPLLREVRTKAGEDTELDLGSTRPGSVDGLVLDPAGRPVRGAAVSAILLSGARLVGGTDEEGRIRSEDGEGVPNGRMRLVVEKDGFAPAVTEPLDLAAGASVTVRLTRGGTIAGRVFSGGEPAPDVDVRLLRPLRAEHGEWESTDAEGRFTLPGRVPAGPARVEVRAPGRLPVVRDVQVHDGETTELSIDLP